MPLDTQCTDVAYLTGRLAAIAYPDGTWDIPDQTMTRMLTNPLEGLALLAPHLQPTDEVDDIMALMPADPPTHLDTVAQWPFWAGYYHQRSASSKAAKLSADMLREVGEALFGERWQTDLANALGFSDSARIRQFLRGERSIPAGVFADAMALLRQKSEQTRSLAERIEQATRPVDRAG